MFKNALVWVSMLVFALLVMPLTFLLGFYNTFFDESFYTKDLAAFTYNFVTEHIPPNSEGDTLGEINEKDLEQIFKEIFTENDFADFYGKSFAAVKKDLSNVTNGDVTLHLPLSTFKSKKTAFAAELADILYARIPVCADKVKPNSFECKESGLSKADFSTRVLKITDITLFSKIPDTFDLVAKVPTYFGQNVWGFVHGTFYWIFVVGFLVALVFLAFIALLIKRPWQAVLRAEAKALLLPATLLLIFAAGLYFFPSLSKEEVASEEMNNFVLLNLLSLFFRAFALNLFFYVVPVMLLASGGMFYSLNISNNLSNEPS